MNILVITEAFKSGGLETQTVGFCKQMKKLGHKVFFVTGKGSRTELLAELTGDNVLEVDINPTITGYDTINTINQIVKFALSRGCDLVHCHPFISIIIGGLVAAEIKKPFTISLHGPASMGIVYGSVYRLFLETLFLYAWRIFCVSPEVKDKAVRLQRKGNYVYLPNGVDLDDFILTESHVNGPWAMISRLDPDKIPGIKHFLKIWSKIRENSSVGPVHIFGEGFSENELQNWVIEEFGAGQEWIRFNGHCSDLACVLKNGYCGVAGMGRVILEGAALNLPAILVGYDGVKGLISTHRANELFEKNFSGRGCNSIESSQLEAQLVDLDSNPFDYQLRTWVTENANEDNIWKKFLLEIQALNEQHNVLLPSVCDFLTQIGDRMLLSQEVIPGIIESFNSQDCDRYSDFIFSILISETLRLQQDIANTRVQEAMYKQALFEQRMQFEEVKGIYSQTLERNQEAFVRNERTFFNKEKELMQQIAALHTTIEELSSKLTSNERTFFNKEKELMQQIAALHTTIEELSSKLTSNERTFFNKEKELMQQITALHTTIEELSNKLTSVESKKLEIELRLQELVHEIEGGRHLYDIDTVLEELEQIRQQLFIIRRTIAYRTAHLLKLVRSEVIQGNWEQRKNILKFIIKRLFKSSGSFADKNSLLLLERQIQAIVNKLIKDKPCIIALPKQELRKEQTNFNKNSISKKVKTTLRVAYLTNQVVDWFDLRPRFGGGERYCISLSNLLKDLGFDVTIYQAGKKHFETSYYGFKVVGIPVKEYYSEFHYGVCNDFYQISQEYDHVIYNLPEYSSGKMRPDSIMVCHGIWFDHNNYHEPISFRSPKWFEHLYKSFSNPRSIISVDTNSINVTRALWPELATKMHFIPNFVDTKQFSPNFEKRNKEKLVILFPRRSQVNRGSRILEAILTAIPHDCSFVWVGEGDAEDTELIQEIAKRDLRLTYCTANFEEMPNIYQNADICVIPTIACEGTSFSCIESLSSGCATVSTNVGGLSDIIQPGVNGILVDPTPSGLASAINFLITNRREREKLQQAGLISAKNFDIVRWRGRWKRLLAHLGWIAADESEDIQTYMWF